jgi:type IV pilus assembly protein PilO
MNSDLLRDIITIRRRSFGLLAFLVLVNLSLFLFLSFWQQPELERAQKDWFAKREAAARGVDRGVTASYREKERELGLFRERIIAKKDFAGFLSELFAAAKGNSLALKSVTYKPTPVKAEGLLSYSIGFNVTGKYAGVKSFIADLARFPKLVTVDSIALGNTSNIEEFVDLRVQLTVLLKMEGA